MAKPKTYYVDPERNLLHNGEVFPGGSKITLDPDSDEAKGLLEGGIISENKPAEVIKVDLDTALAELAAVKTELADLKKAVAEATDLKKLQASLKPAE